MFYTCASDKQRTFLANIKKSFNFNKYIYLNYNHTQHVQLKRESSKKHLQYNFKPYTTERFKKNNLKKQWLYMQQHINTHIYNQIFIYRVHIQQTSINTILANEREYNPIIDPHVNNHHFRRDIPDIEFWMDFFSTHDDIDMYDFPNNTYHIIESIYLNNLDENENSDSEDEINSYLFLNNVGNRSRSSSVVYSNDQLPHNDDSNVSFNLIDVFDDYSQDSGPPPQSHYYDNNDSCNNVVENAAVENTSWSNISENLRSYDDMFVSDDDDINSELEYELVIQAEQNRDLEILTRELEKQTEELEKENQELVKQNKEIQTEINYLHYNNTLTSESDNTSSNTQPSTSTNEIYSPSTLIFCREESQIIFSDQVESLAKKVNTSETQHNNDNIQTTSLTSTQENFNYDTFRQIFFNNLSEDEIFINISQKN